MPVQWVRPWEYPEFFIVYNIHQPRIKVTAPKNQTHIVILRDSVTACRSKNCTFLHFKKMFVYSLFLVVGEI
jgi:hypothetical protein